MRPTLAETDPEHFERLAGALVHILVKDERLKPADIHRLVDEVKRRCPA